MKIVLASRSPRRKQLLEEAGFEVEVDVSNLDEKDVKKEDVIDLVMELAKLKVQIVAKRHPDSIIVGADTLVYFNGEEIGQPVDEKDAEEIMNKLNGTTHEVVTGLYVVNTNNGKFSHEHEVSEVKLRKINEEKIKEYITLGLYKGKAGAYNIDDPEFETFIESIKGPKSNVMGLPIEKVKEMINKVV